MAETTMEMVRDFSHVILTLDNVLLTADKLSPTPSMVDGLDSKTENDLRILGCELIQTSGILLKLPQVAMATGQVLFQRFYYSKSFVKHNMEVLAMACINLASKIEEAPRRIRDVINVFHHIKQVRGGKTISPLILDQNYINLKNQVIKAERRILKELGFCVHIKHPHKIIVTYLQVLDCHYNQKFVQYAWNYMNDSFRTNVFVMYQPETIACACIYLAARQLQICLPNNPSWFSLFLVDEDDLRDISRKILRLYDQKKPNVDELEKAVNECRKLHNEAKLKAKGLASEGATPNSSSRPATPARVSPSPLTQANVKKLKEGDKSDHSSFSGHLNHTSRGKKRSHSRSRSRGSRSRSRSRSKSRSPYRSSSRSPRSMTPPRKYKKESYKATSGGRSKHQAGSGGVAKYGGKEGGGGGGRGADSKENSKDSYYRDYYSKKHYAADYYGEYYRDHGKEVGGGGGRPGGRQSGGGGGGHRSASLSPARSRSFSRSPAERVERVDRAERAERVERTGERGGVAKAARKKAYKDKEHPKKASRSRSRDRHRSNKKHHNGHRRSRSRDRYRR